MNYWNQKDLPHKGWSFIKVIDTREDGQTNDETDYASCNMCGNEKLRYVHIMRHPEVSNDIEVGCICAEKMSSDYINPKKNENTLKNKANQRTRWLQRKWKLSANGNYYMELKGNHLLVFRKKNRWSYKFNKTFSNESFLTIDEAKLALFETFYKKRDFDLSQHKI